MTNEDYKIEKLWQEIDSIKELIKKNNDLRELEIEAVEKKWLEINEPLKKRRAEIYDLLDEA